jgi:hypothetical protein
MGNQRKPPKENQFKPGEKRHPDAGKKKGYKSIKTVLKEINRGTLEIDDPILKTKLKRTPHELICLKMVTDAMKGDARARNEYFNRLEGRPNEKIDLTHAGGININLPPEDIEKEIDKLLKLREKEKRKPKK